MSITRTVVCSGKVQNVRRGLGELLASFSSPLPEGSARVGNDEPATVALNHVHFEGLTKEEWDALEPGREYTLTIS